MTRRLSPAVLGACLVGVVIGIALVLSFQWLTAAGAPVPREPVAAGASAQSTPPRTPVGLPNRDRTPGAINLAATQATLGTTVCKAGWAASVRPTSAYTSALKIAQLLEYGYADRNPADYQEDHLVPLELGGAPRDPRNLWPQPNEVVLPDGTKVGSKEKDDLEDVLHDRVCSGVMTLDDAQLSMATDWILAWQTAGMP